MADMQQIYRKNKEAKLDEEFRVADQYGAVKIGTEHFFWKKLLHWYYLPAAEVKQLYRQIQQVESYTSCCEADFSIQRLNMILQNGEELSVMIGDSFYRHEPEMMMEKIATYHPQIVQMAPAIRKR